MAGKIARGIFASCFALQNSLASGDATKCAATSKRCSILTRQPPTMKFARLRFSLSESSAVLQSHPKRIKPHSITQWNRSRFRPRSCWRPWSHPLRRKIVKLRLKKRVDDQPNDLVHPAAKATTAAKDCHVKSLREDVVHHRR